MAQIEATPKGGGRWPASSYAGLGAKRFDELRCRPDYGWRIEYLAMTETLKCLELSRRTCNRDLVCILDRNFTVVRAM